MEQQQSEGQAGAMDALPAVNEVTIVGRLANTPKLKNFGEDKLRAQFMVAVPRSPLGGNAKRGYDYLAVVAWRAMARQCDGLAKGDGVHVGGRMHTWQDETKRFHWEIEADTFKVLDRQTKARMMKQGQLAGV